MNTLESTAEQLAAVNAFFDEQAQISDRLVYVDDAAQDQDEANNNKNGELLAA
ncbi:hypothetical protein D9M72_658420 [compost metagenome]